MGPLKQSHLIIKMMGFVKRNIELEEYLDTLKTDWRQLSDTEYRNILQTLDDSIDKGYYSEYEGEEAFAAFMDRLPFDGYIFSAPKHKHFSANESGGINLTFGYEFESLPGVERNRINSIECVIADRNLSFCCIFHHEWQSLVPEHFLELRSDE